METQTEIPVLQKTKATMQTKEQAVGSSSCCTPKNNATVCCTPSTTPTENDGACCAQPEDGSACCDK